MNINIYTCVITNFEMTVPVNESLGVPFRRNKLINYYLQVIFRKHFNYLNN